MNVRSGPGTAYPIVATATQGQAFAVTGRSNDGTWLEVDLTNGQVGWIAAALVETNVTTDQIGLAATIPTAPAPLSIPIPTPIVNDAVFLPPVDPNVVPLYNAFDLNPQNGVVEIQSAKYPPRTDFGCSGGFFLPGTPDNHFAWDYGTGNCSKHLVDTLVYGMSVGFQGEVLDVSFDSPRYPIRVDYGKIRCTDGRVRSITIQYAHSLPRVKMGDRVDSNTAIASLENVSVEVEIQVFGDGRNIDPRLIGLNLP
jgi:hypothetical protein